MSEKKYDDISDDLNLSYSEVAAFDQAVTSGEALNYYDNSQINRATVYKNKISGRVGNYFDFYDVLVTFHGSELVSSCTCAESTEHNVCVHAIALLYGWVNDGGDFTNVADALNKISELPRERLEIIIKNILRRHPHLIDDFLDPDRAEWDEIDQDPTL